MALQQPLHSLRLETMCSRDMSPKGHTLTTMTCLMQRSERVHH